MSAAVYFLTVGLALCLASLGLRSLAWPVCAAGGTSIIVGAIAGCCS